MKRQQRKCSATLLLDIFIIFSIFATSLVILYEKIFLLDALFIFLTLEDKKMHCIAYPWLKTMSTIKHYHQQKLRRENNGLKIEKLRHLQLNWRKFSCFPCFSLSRFHRIFSHAIKSFNFTSTMTLLKNDFPSFCLQTFEDVDCTTTLCSFLTSLIFDITMPQIATWKWYELDLKMKAKFFFAIFMKWNVIFTKIEVGKSIEADKFDNLNRLGMKLTINKPMMSL